MILNSKLYPHHIAPVFKGDGEHDYLADDKLRRVVNLAIALGRPLLVRGEPGVGKTQLARAIASELTSEKLLEWRIKSTDTVRDGLYFYDPIRRLIDTQLSSAERRDHVDRAFNPYHYIRFSYLGKAIIDPDPVVLLIDEIDKADIDFPNDLLRELEEWWFQIYEVPLAPGNVDVAAFGVQQHNMTEQDILRAATESPDAASKFAIIHIGAKPRPIVIITSNDEKPLPPAFLRRCIVHTIEFPNLNADDPTVREKNRGDLTRIIEMNVRKRLGLDPQELNQRVIERVLDVFGLIRKERDRWNKPPATVELVEWVVALHHPALNQTLLNLTGDQPLPYWQVLFKNPRDEQFALETELLRGKLEVI
ncbi:MAG: MoxR family ATPase [Anaerolineae bacterium]